MADERIPKAIDGWGQLSEMPRKLAWLVAYVMGMWGFPMEGEPPRGPRYRELWEEPFPTPEVWKQAVDDTIDSDQHKVMMAGLMAWLNSGKREWEVEDVAAVRGAGGRECGAGWGGGGVSEATRPLTTERIPDAIDSWRVPSELPFLRAGAE